MSKYIGGALIPTLSIVRNDRTTITVQLVSALRELILSGRLRAGDRLPASRTLARDHGLSRTTAVNAYEQLTAEGLIRSHVGSGTFISDTVLQAAPRPGNAPAAPETADDNAAGNHAVGDHAADTQTAAPRLAQRSAEATERYLPRLAHPQTPRAFVTGVPAFDVFPMALWARLTARFWRSPRSRIMGYPDPCGLPALRQGVSQHLRANRGVTCAPEEVFIFNGAQDAFNRIGALLLDPGDAVWFENPGTIGARNSLISGGARLVPVPVDAAGLDVASGLRAAPDFRMVFVTPAHQHPLGTTMTVARRFELLRAAEAAGAWIVEDDYVGEFHYGSHAPVPLKSMDTGGRVIYVGTFSKSMFPGLRLGYVVAPPQLAPVFRRLAGATLQGAPSSTQAIMADFMDQGHFASHIRRMRGVYAERRDALMAAAARDLEGLLHLHPTETGFHTLGDLSDPLTRGGLSARAVADAACAAGIATAPLCRYTLAPVARQAITLGFSAVPPAQIARGVADLARVIEGLAAAPRGRGSTRPVSRDRAGSAPPPFRRS